MATVQHLDRLLESFVEGGLPGCGMIVRQRGKILYERYAGCADIEGKVPVSADSIFRQASMSKIPLYVTVMKLFEEGRFLLSDPIEKYLPEWSHMRKYIRHPNGSVDIAPVSRPITIRDTLSMTCGMPYCNSSAPTDDLTMRSMQECMKPLWAKGYFTLQEHLAAMSGAVLACDPGERWIYGFSSELAAGLVEKVCGAGIDEVFHELLFKPLDMTNTASRFFGDTQSRMVKLYAFDEQHQPKELDMPMDRKHLPGAEHEAGWARLFSTVEDYSHLLSMLACGGQWEGKRILGRRTIDLMRTSGLMPTQREGLMDAYNGGYSYGLGVRTLVDQAAGNHNGSLGAFGWTGGFGTWCEADPEEELAIVYMHNTCPNEEQYYHLRVRAAAYGLVD